jgi:hypothetical protein
MQRVSERAPGSCAPNVEEAVRALLHVSIGYSEAFVNVATFKEGQVSLPDFVKDAPYPDEICEPSVRVLLEGLEQRLLRPQARLGGFRQRRIEALEKSQGFGSSSESQPTAQARRTMFALRLADVTRLKMSMADCPDAWCSCGHYGRQFECAHCQAQYCQANCQVVIKEDDNPTKKGRCLVCKRCHRDDGKPLELMVTAKLPPHSRTLRCEAHISFARKCINRLVHECRFCNRWLCEYCTGHRPVCVCVCHALRRPSITLSS